MLTWFHQQPFQPEGTHNLRMLVRLLYFSTAYTISSLPIRLSIKRVGHRGWGGTETEGG